LRKNKIDQICFDIFTLIYLTVHLAYKFHINVKIKKNGDGKDI
jgi:hypothetical protein